MKKEICLFCANEIQILGHKEESYTHFLECGNCGTLWDYKRILAIDELLREVFNKPFLRNIPEEEAYRQKYLSFYKEIKSLDLQSILTEIKKLKQKKVRTRLSRIRQRLAKNDYTDELGFMDNLGVLIGAISIVSVGVWMHINVSFDLNWFWTIIVFLLKWTIAFPFILAIAISIPYHFMNLLTPSLSAKQQKKRDLKQKRINLRKTDELINKYTEEMLNKYPSLRILVFSTN
tara:strand:- start:79 stop:777 length:699 start_codon:yes stop_codon:yes gene_type:complete